MGMDKVISGGQEIAFKFERPVNQPSEGRVVTLINGFARTHTDFKIMSRRLLEHGHSVLMFDNRGSGFSPSQGKFEFEDMVRDVEVLWNHLGIQRSVVVGISMGGMIAQCLASRSQVPTGTVLVSTASGKEYFTKHQVAPRGKEEDVREALNHYFHPNFISGNKILFDAMVKQLSKNSEKGEDDTSNLAGQREAIRRFEFSSVDYSKIDHPVLILHGDSDEVILPDSASNLKSKLPQASLKIYEGCGHLILAEKPKLFYDDVLGFLDGR